ncbi:MAG: murein hydrolase activator EnvC family protein [Clostridia bacterium]
MKIKKRILISILLILIILSTNIAVTLAATKSELQNKQNNINQQIKDTENEISAVKEEMSDTMKQIQDLNTQISGYQSEIDDLEYKISDLEKDIEESQEKLNEAEKKYNKQEEAFKNRIVAQYEAGETTYLDVLLGGGSLWDMVSNWYVVSEIADLDNQMLGQMEKNKNEIEEAKKALETNKEQIEVTKKNKEQKASALKSSQATKEQYVNELSDNEKELNAELEKLKKANDAITRELKAMENKYSDKIANLGGTGTLQRPVRSGVITATMYYSSGRYHGALDYGVPVGTEVYAAAEGVVLAANWSNGGLGNYVCIQHSGGLRTYYGHGNGEFYVKPGDVVKKGQLIMLSGNTGNSSGPHLHFEVRVSPYNWSYWGNDSRRDPRNYL